MWVWLSFSGCWEEGQSSERMPAGDPLASVQGAGSGSTPREPLWFTQTGLRFREATAALQVPQGVRAACRGAPAGSQAMPPGFRLPRPGQWHQLRAGSPQYYPESLLVLK